MSSLAVCRSAAPSFSGLVQLTGQLYLSNSKAAADGARVSACRISCIVNATEKAKTVPVPGVEYLRVSVADSPDAQIADHFESVADKIRDVAEGGGRTLVHCSAGVSRSAALCLAYLMRHRHMTLEEAHRWVKALRPIIRPNPGFWKQLIAYELKIYGKNTVKMIESPIGEVPDVYEKETRDLIPC